MDTKTEIKELNSRNEMLNFTFNVFDRIIIHILSKNLDNITHVDDKNSIPFDFFIMIYDYNVEDREEKNKVFLEDNIFES